MQEESDKDFDKKEKILELEQMVKKVLELKNTRPQRRPLFIEFCGSPKSGKSTTINSLSMFLRRNGFRTEVLTERAGICPIENKTHPNFNLWTLCAVVAEILEKLERGKENTDIIIADRGVYDALCWFHWLNTNPSTRNPYLSNELFNDLLPFITSDMWKRTIDLVYVFKVSPATSIEREYASLLTEKRGSIMREEVLETYNSSIEEVDNQYSKRFRQVITIETDENGLSGKPNVVNYTVTKAVLEDLIDLMDEKIAFLPQAIFSNKSNIGILRTAKLMYANRNEVEKNDSLIQLIPIAVITDKERKRVLVVKKNAKSTSKDSPEKDKVLLYIGGHVRNEDEEENDCLKTINNALHREIQEEINESISVNNTKPFLVYSDATQRSKCHIGICYVVEMDLENKQFKIASNELTMKSGTSKSGRIMYASELVNEKLEEWSIQILDHVFRVKYDSRQGDLFS